MVRLYKWNKDPQSVAKSDGTDVEDVSFAPIDEGSPDTDEQSSEASFEPPDFKLPDIESASAARKKPRDEMRRRGEVLETPMAQREIAEPQMGAPHRPEPEAETDVRLFSFVKRDRSSRIRWLLNELAVPFRQEWLDPYTGEHLSPEYLALNPFGRVPVLQIDNLTLYESGAIMMHLLETYGDASIIPEEGSTERPYFWQWFHWGLTTLDSAVIDYLNTLPPVLEDGETDPFADEMDPAVQEQLESVLDPLDTHLSGRDYLLSSFSAADIVVGHMLGLLSRRYGFEDFPTTKGYLARLLRRPAAADFLEGLRE